MNKDIRNVIIEEGDTVAFPFKYTISTAKVLQVSKNGWVELADGKFHAAEDLLVLPDEYIDSVGGIDE
ncbi:hypothetical protein NVP1084O_052 [Vibrio phage 1.084.O._10N.261.49.F5]|nr:hypothetical protein NVP1084O_052 [Vibrio phage 1.084.O._10N.261.49.F5]